MAQQVFPSANQGQISHRNNSPEESERCESTHTHIKKKKKGKAKLLLFLFSSFLCIFVVVVAVAVAVVVVVVAAAAIILNLPLLQIGNGSGKMGQHKGKTVTFFPKMGDAPAILTPEDEARILNMVSLLVLLFHDVLLVLLFRDILQSYSSVTS